MEYTYREVGLLAATAPVPSHDVLAASLKHEDDAMQDVVDDTARLTAEASDIEMGIRFNAALVESARPERGFTLTYLRVSDPGALPVVRAWYARTRGALPSDGRILPFPPGVITMFRGRTRYIEYSTIHLMDAMAAVLVDRYDEDTLRARNDAVDRIRGASG